MARYNIDVSSTAQTSGLDAATASLQRQQQAADQLRASMQRMAQVGQSVASGMTRATTGGITGAVGAAAASAKGLVASVGMGLSRAAATTGAVIRTAIGGALSTATRAAGLLTGALGAARATIAGMLGIGGLAGAIGFLGATREAMNFEDQLGIINTIAHATKETLNGAIGQGIRDVARKTGVDIKDLTRGFYDLLSAGLGFDVVIDKATGLRKEVLNVKDSLGLLQQAAVLGLAGLGSTDDAIDLMTTLVNAFNLKLTDAKLVVDVFAKSVELGKVTVAELGEAMSTVAPLAGAMGVSIQEVAAGIAAMTQQGFTGSEATTTMRSFIVGIQRNSKALQESVNVLPKKFRDSKTAWEDFLKARGLNATAERVRAAAKKYDIPLIKLLGRIEGVQFVLGTTGKNQERWNRAIKAMKNAEGTALGQFAERLDTAHRRLQRLIQSVRDFAIEIGTPLLKPIGEFFLMLAHVVQAMTDWARQHPQAVANIGKLVAAMSALLALRAGAQALLFLLGPLGSAFLAFGTGARTASLALAALSVPIVAILGAFTLFQVAVDKNLLGLGAFNVAMTDLKIAIDLVAPAVGKFFELLGALFSGDKMKIDAKAKAFGNLLGQIRDALGRALAGAGRVFSTVILPRLRDGLINAWDDFVDNVPTYLKKAGDLAVALAGWVTSLLPDLAQTGFDIVDGILDGISDAWDGLFEAVSGGPGGGPGGRRGGQSSPPGFLDRLVEATRENLRETWDVITSWAGEKAGKIGEVMGPLVQGFADAFASLFQSPPTNGPGAETGATSPIQRFVNQLVTGILAFGQQAADRVGEELQKILTAIGEWWTVNGPAITTAIKGLVDGVLAFGQSVGDRIGESLQDLLDDMATWWTDNQEAVKTSLKGLATGFAQWMTDEGVPALLGGLGGFADMLFPVLFAGAATVIGAIIEVGSFIGSGILQGIVEFFEDFPQKFGEHMNNLANNAVLIGKIVLAGAAIGLILRGAMFLTGLWVDAMTGLFGLLRKGLVYAAVWALGVILGGAMRLAMFLGSAFISAAAAVISSLGTSSAIVGAGTGAAAVAGASIGGVIAASIAGAITLAGVAAGAIAVAIGGLGIGVAADKLLPPSPADSVFRPGKGKGGFIAPTSEGGGIQWFLQQIQDAITGKKGEPGWEEKITSSVKGAVTGGLKQGVTDGAAAAADDLTNDHGMIWGSPMAALAESMKKALKDSAVGAVTGGINAKLAAIGAQVSTLGAGFNGLGTTVRTNVEQIAGQQAILAARTATKAAQIGNTIKTLKTAFGTLNVNLRPSGFATMSSYADGLRAAQAKVAAAVATAAAAVALLHANSPPRHPMIHDIATWGYVTMLEYANGLMSGVNGPIASAMSAAAREVYGINGLTTALGASDRTVHLESKVAVRLEDPNGLAASVGYTSAQASADVRAGAEAFLKGMEREFSAVVTG